MALRVVYRAYGGENLKDRPSFYGKERALQSTVRAAAGAGAEVVFLNDGPVPEPLERIMREHGEVLTLPQVGLRGSLHRALRLPSVRRWHPDDLVYFCEDDYLHRPDALTRLAAAAQVLPAQYLTTYGLEVGEEAAGLWDHEARAGDVYVPPRWRPIAPREVDGLRWVQIPASTSTFAARVGPLRHDLGIVRMAGWPHRRMLRDRDVCLTYAGYRSHRWRALGRDALLLSGGPVRDRLRHAALVPFKAAMNVRALRLPSHRHVLVAPFPNLATHLESAFLAPGRDWSAVADATDEWAAARGAP